MDHEILTLFSLEEFTDLSHGMTAQSTKSKRKAAHPLTGWEDTNQPQPKRRKAIAVPSKECDRPSNAQTYQQ